MAQPGEQVVIDEDVARQAEERYAQMEAELQTLRQQNEGLTREVLEQRDVVETERRRADRRSRAQVQDFANLTAELIAGRRGPEIQFEGMRIGVKVEKPDSYDGGKKRDVDTWLFQVQEHLNLTNIPARGHVAYAASLLRGNAAMWWRELCESNNRPNDWNQFRNALREQFQAENLNRRGRDDLATIRQYGRESVADFLFRFREVCLKISDLSEAEKLDRFLRALVPNVRVQVELRGPAQFQEAAMYAERADAVLTRVSGQDSGKKWHKPNVHASGSSQQAKQTGGSGSGQPEPMEIGAINWKPMTPEERRKLMKSKACFFCRKPNAGHMARDCPLRQNRQGNGKGR